MRLTSPFLRVLCVCATLGLDTSAEENVSLQCTISGEENVVPDTEYTYTATASNGDGDYEYEWSGVESSNDNTAQAKVPGSDEDGQVTITCTATDDGGGWQEHSESTPTFTFGPDEEPGRYRFKARAKNSVQTYVESSEILVVEIKIKRNGQDITDQTTEVWVGESIKLVSEIGPSDIHDEIDEYEWDMSMTPVGGYTFDDDSGDIDELCSSDLDDDDVTFYWIDGDPDGEEKTVDFSVGLRGQTLQTQLAFTVFRPAFIHFESSMSDGYPMVGNVLVDGIIDYGLWKAGDPQQGDAGIAFCVSPAEALQGNVCVIPIVNVYESESEWDNGVFGTSHNHYMDIQCTDVCGIKYMPHTSANYVDLPGNPIDQATYYWTRRDDKFTTVVMYKPPTPNAIYVPVVRVTWRWKARASKVGSSFVLGDVVHPPAVWEAPLSYSPEWTHMLDLDNPY